jgi:hypothetical protein
VTHVYAYVEACDLFVGAPYIGFHLEQECVYGVCSG